MRFSNSEVPRGGGGGGESKQYYLVREADPSVVFYLHFGACKVVSNYSLSRFLNMGGRGGRAYFRTLAPTQLYLCKIRSTKGM